MGIYATEDIWHGQEVMMVNQEQTNKPEENSLLRLVEESEPSCGMRMGTHRAWGRIQKAPERLLLRGLD